MTVIALALAMNVLMLFPISRLVRFLGRDLGALPEPVTAVAQWMYAELKPFYLPAIITSHALASISDDSFQWWRVLVTAIHLTNWWLARNDKDDDDRWKRRRKRLVEKVAQVGGKLQVVPAGAR